jgi:integrase/recombinase XerC
VKYLKTYKEGRTLSIKAIQKKMERYTTTAGVKASCHSLRHTFASNLLEEGAEIVSIKEFLGHRSVTSSERYARLSNQRVKQTYMQTMGKTRQTEKISHRIPVFEACLSLRLKLPTTLHLSP